MLALLGRRSGLRLPSSAVLYPATQHATSMQYSTELASQAHVLFCMLVATPAPVGAMGVPAC